MYLNVNFSKCKINVVEDGNLTYKEIFNLCSIILLKDILKILEIYIESIKKKMRMGFISWKEIFLLKKIVPYIQIFIKIRIFIRFTFQLYSLIR